MDQLNKLFNETGYAYIYIYKFRYFMQKISILFDKNKYCRARVTFSLNALMGRKKAAVQEAGTILMEGKWDPRNAYDLMKYTASKGYKIDSYELGKLDV